MAAGLAPVWAMAAGSSQAGKEYVEPALDNIGRAAQSLADPGAAQVPTLWLPAAPARDSSAGRMVDYVRRWWAAPLGEMAESNITMAARHLADPHATDLPELYAPGVPPDRPLAGSAVRFIQDQFVDPLARQAQTAALRAARGLGSEQAGSTDIPLPELRFGWADILDLWAPRSRGIRLDLSAVPDPVRSAPPAKESRSDSVRMIQRGRTGPPGRVQGKSGAFKRIERSP